MYDLVLKVRRIVWMVIGIKVDRDGVDVMVEVVNSLE